MINHTDVHDILNKKEGIQYNSEFFFLMKKYKINIMNRCEILYVINELDNV